jgi:LacI family transcriptional regulator, galactose operon repressor
VTASGRTKAHERVTIGHVAQRAGVSAGTVSNYLNRPHTVAPATRTRIQAAIEELRFVRNANASQLRSGRFRAIGLVVLDVANPFFTEVARGVEDAARDADYVTILCNSDESIEREQRYLEVLEERQVECILISPVGDAQRQLRTLRERGRRVVLVDRTSPSADQCAVAVDDVRGGELAVAHLLETGHSRIACVSGPLSIHQCADRLAGARRAVDAAGRDPDEVLEVIELASLSVTSGREATGRLLGRRDAPTAAFCANDLLALGLLAGAQADGRSVPDELAIIGYDDIEFAADAAIPLSSIRQPKYELGHAAARLALDEARDPAGHAHQQIVFQPELVVRESTEGSGA